MRTLEQMKKKRLKDYKTNMQRWRTEANITLEEVSQELGVKLETYYTWEQGQRLPRDESTKVKLVKFFGCKEPSELI